MRPHKAGWHLYMPGLAFVDVVYTLTRCSSLPMPCACQESVRKTFPLNVGGSDTCYFCKKRVYVMERLSAEGHFFHRECFRCSACATTLRLAAYAFDVDEGNPQGPGQHLSLAWAPDSGGSGTASTSQGVLVSSEKQFEGQRSPAKGRGCLWWAGVLRTGELAAWGRGRRRSGWSEGKLPKKVDIWARP